MTREKPSIANPEIEKRRKIGEAVPESPGRVPPAKSNNPQSTNANPAPIREGVGGSKAPDEGSGDARAGGKT